MPECLMPLRHAKWFQVGFLLFSYCYGNLLQVSFGTPLNGFCVIYKIGCALPLRVIVGVNDFNLGEVPTIASNIVNDV